MGWVTAREHSARKAHGFRRLPGLESSRARVMNEYYREMNW